MLQRIKIRTAIFLHDCKGGRDDFLLYRGGPFGPMHRHKNETNVIQVPPPCSRTYAGEERRGKIFDGEGTTGEWGECQVVGPST